MPGMCRGDGDIAVRCMGELQRGRARLARRRARRLHTSVRTASAALPSRHAVCPAGVARGAEDGGEQQRVRVCAASNRLADAMTAHVTVSVLMVAKYQARR